MDTTKGLLEEIKRRFIKFDMNEKHHYLDLLINTKYDGVKGARDHIMLLSSYYNKSKGPKMKHITWEKGKSTSMEDVDIARRLDTRR